MRDGRAEFKALLPIIDRRYGSMLYAHQRFFIGILSRQMFHIIDTLLPLCFRVIFRLGDMSRAVTLTFSRWRPASVWFCFLYRRTRGFSHYLIYLCVYNKARWAGMRSQDILSIAIDLLLATDTLCFIRA